MAEANAHTGLEIASRITKVIFHGLGGIVVWALYIGGAYAVYVLWAIDKTSSLYWRSDVSGQLAVCIAVIVGIVIVRAVQVAVNWAVVVPLQARIHGIDLQDPEVRSELKTTNLVHFAIEGFGLLVCLLVPLAIAHFRFHHFA